MTISSQLPPRKIWDISPPLDEHTAVLPGDKAYSQRLHFALTPDWPVNVKSLTLSPHTSAHADAPTHYAQNVAASGELELAPYLGPCRVIHCIDCGPLVLSEHIAHALDVGRRTRRRLRADCPTLETDAG